MTTSEFKKLLVPVDFSETSLSALDRAVQLAKLNNAALYLIHICEELPVKSNVDTGAYNPVQFATDVEEMGQKYIQYENRLEDEAKIKLEKLAVKIRKKGIEKVEVLVVTGKVDTEIISAVKTYKIDLIVMGTHGTKGFREFIAGSNTYRIVRKAPCAVLSMQEGFNKNTIKKILLPFRDKAHSRESVEYAVKMAKLYNASIHVLGIDTEKEEEHFQKVRIEAEQIEKAVTKRGVKCSSEILPASFLTRIILKHAQLDKADMVALVSDLDRMGLAEYFTGPVIKQIVNHSVLPILSIRPQYNANLTPAVG